MHWWEALWDLKFIKTCMNNRLKLTLETFLRKISFKCILQIFLMCLIKSPWYTDKNSKKNVQRFSFPVFWCTKNMKFHFWWGTNPRDQKQVTGNDCDVISGLEVSGKTDFSNIFLFSYKQRTFVPFLGEFISSQYKNDW